MPPMRKIVLAVALAATIVASVVELPALDVAPPGKAGVPAAAVAGAAAPPIAAVSEAAPVARFDVQTSAADLFAARSWQPPPPPAPPASRAEAPKAPPLPFIYLGKVLEDGAVMAFVGQGARTHLLRRGDVVADYKVEQITPADITFVYLPLNEKQRLTFGSAH